MQDASLNAGTMQRNAWRPCGLLVDRQSLLREGIKLVLEAIGYRIEAEAERASAALSDPDCSDKYDFIVATLRPDDADLDAIRTLRQSWPRARLIIFADTASNPTLMIKSFEAGADGCVLLDIKPDVLRQSLDLIMLGERVFPSALLLKHLSQGDRNAKQGDAPHLQSSFSARDD